MRTRPQQLPHSPLYAHVMSVIYLIVIFLFFQVLIGIGGALLLVVSIVGTVVLVQWNHRRVRENNERARQDYIAWYKDQQKRSQNYVPPKPQQPSQQQQQQSNDPFWGGDLDEFYAWDTDENGF